MGGGGGGRLGEGWIFGGSARGTGESEFMVPYLCAHVSLCESLEQRSRLAQTPRRRGYSLIRQSLPPSLMY